MDRTYAETVEWLNALDTIEAWTDCPSCGYEALAFRSPGWVGPVPLPTHCPECSTRLAWVEPPVGLREGGGL